MQFPGLARIFVQLVIAAALTGDVLGRTPTDSCLINALPNIVFKKGKTSLTKSAKATLDQVVIRLTEHPLCKIKIQGQGTNNYVGRQSRWEKVNSVIDYLITKGISRERIVFPDGIDGPASIVLLIATTEDGPNNIPPPHPGVKARE